MLDATPEHHEYLVNFAAEALDYESLSTEDDAWFAAHAKVVAAIEGAALAALEAERSRPDVHDVSDDHAVGMVIETGVDPGGYAGRLLYLRAYVATSDIS